MDKHALDIEAVKLHKELEYRAENLGLKLNKGLTSLTPIKEDICYHDYHLGMITISKSFNSLKELEYLLDGYELGLEILSLEIRGLIGNVDDDTDDRLQKIWDKCSENTKRDQRVSNNKPLAERYPGVEVWVKHCSEEDWYKMEA